MLDSINRQRIALFFNTQELGGAERSIIEQMRQIEDEFEITFFIPFNNHLGNSSLLSSALKNNNQLNIKYYWYPHFLYSISRRFASTNVIKIMLGGLALIMAYGKLVSLKKFDIVYANGTKAGVFLIIYLFLSRYRGLLVWHFRDYPPAWRFSKWIDMLFQLKRRFKVYLIGNSISVKQEIMNVFKKADRYDYVYNPIEKQMHKKMHNRSHGKTIGVVSMFAPWKGIHNIILFAALYGERLKEMGINKIKIYGRNIYKTSGEHCFYGDQIKKLASKLGADLVSFDENKNPDEIFQEIDLLIHPSIKKEPFGRVILEAFRCGIPVLSTGLGGAGELVIPDQTGFIFNKNDLESLFLLIKKIYSSETDLGEIIRNASAFEELVTNSVGKRLKLFLKGLDFEQEIEDGKGNIVGS
ncbi:MAG: hypothetical protein A2381_05145 [Bdellovibrionales bacterium RIFOXYB1_FULL_37_110]|nr:MAG: hypothetical protein A2417_16625 [Bdellovibrionales bacterium RIFOXYC1_FULL_37_79]OFZ58131.1 MAG: hypothetical protein A2381_05145 [Bdellovibrionales bacterium RIFOXYB1_FULL_37_110]OFZ61820.1 MAG: hypothetical protein A2577_18730 [Bdellovibrionales bacterium RIFOXYD1_FULL_36_51]